MILLFIFFSIIIVIALIKNHQPKINQNNNQKIYYRSDIFQPNNSLELALNNLGYIPGVLENATLIIPSGYNNIEYELKNIRVVKTNKYIFGIPGCDKLAAKDSLWQIIETYLGRNTAKKIMPNTYLFNQRGLELFAKDYTPLVCDRYILKKNIQRKEGIYIASSIKEIMDIYHAGDHGIKDFKIIQEYIKNPLCINDHKLNLRLYILIILENNNLNMYCYKDGKCMYTKQPYSAESLNFNETITNFGVSNELYQEKNLPLTWKTLQIQNNNHNISPQSILNLLHNIYHPINAFFKTPEISKNISKFKNITLFQLFGADVIFRPEATLLELNKGPEMSFQTQKEKNLKLGVLTDTLELNLDKFYRVI